MWDMEIPRCLNNTALELEDLSTWSSRITLYTSKNTVGVAKQSFKLRWKPHPSCVLASRFSVVALHICPVWRLPSLFGPRRPCLGYRNALAPTEAQRNPCGLDQWRLGGLHGHSTNSLLIFAPYNRNSLIRSGLIRWRFSGAGGAICIRTDELLSVVSNVGWLDGNGLENKVSSGIRYGRSPILPPLLSRRSVYARVET